MSLAFNGLVRSLTDFLFQSPCPLCDRIAAPILCLDCDHQLRLIPALPPVIHPVADKTSAIPLIALGLYDGFLKRHLSILKYKNQPQLAAPLGTLLAQRFQQQYPLVHHSSPSPHKPAAVIPIPLHAEKLQQRGFNQAELLSRAFCQTTQLPHWPQGLQRIRATQAQYQLSASERATNLKNAFRVGPAPVNLAGVRPRSVILLDDIYTSGTTISEAIKALNIHHISVTAIVTIARGNPNPR